MIKVLLAVLIASQVVPVGASNEIVSTIGTDVGQLVWVALLSACIGFGGFVGLAGAKWVVGKLKGDSLQMKRADPKPWKSSSPSEQGEDDPSGSLAQPLLNSQPYLTPGYVCAACG